MSTCKPVYIGIDWSTAKHDVVFLNKDGRRLLKFVMRHEQGEFLKLFERCQQQGLALCDCHIAIETSYNLLVDFLWSYGCNVYVIPPSVVTASRGRYRSSGAHNDVSDAHLLADLLRTDGQRFVAWQPDSLLTRQMRSLVTLLEQLTRYSTSLSNQLRALLLRYYPAMLALFPNLTTKTALAFLCTYPTPQDAATLDELTLRHFLHQRRYPCPHKLLAKLPLLLTPTLQTPPETALALAPVALALARQLTGIGSELAQAQAMLTTLFRQHPDHDIFASLPGAGDFLAPALLVQFGDQRDRFASAADLQSLAGTSPVTLQSGKARSVRFRRACDHQFRRIITQLAVCAVSNSHAPFAVAYYEELLARGKSQNQAYRCLANRLLAITWKLWRTRTPYDPAFHLQQRLQRRQPLPIPPPAPFTQPQAA